MKKRLVIVVLGLLTLDAGFYTAYADDTSQQGKTNQKSNTEEQGPRAPTTNDACVCYCGGSSWPLGAVACMNGYKFRCSGLSTQGTNCGWDPTLKGSNQVPCDGGEQCK